MSWERGYTKGASSSPRSIVSLNMSVKSVSVLLKNCVRYFSSLNQRTPLHIAVKGGHKEIVEYLVKSNADINITDTKGVSTYMTIYRVSVSPPHLTEHMSTNFFCVFF